MTKDNNAIIFSPVIVRHYAAEQASHYFVNLDATALDLLVGDEDAAPFHVVVTLPVPHISTIVRDAPILKRRLYFMYGRDLGVRHSETGKPVFIGVLHWLRTNAGT